MPIRYAEFQFRKDGAVPGIRIGVVQWDPDLREYLWRFEEEPEGLTEQELTLVRLVKGKVALWAADEKLPYAPEEAMKPWEDRWWAHVRDLLIHRVRLSDTHLATRVEEVPMPRFQGGPLLSTRFRKEPSA
jgi:hypothetical protein